MRRCMLDYRPVRGKRNEEKRKKKERREERGMREEGRGLEKKEEGDIQWDLVRG